MTSMTNDTVMPLHVGIHEALVTYYLGAMDGKLRGVGGSTQYNIFVH